MTCWKTMFNTGISKRIFSATGVMLFTAAACGIFVYLRVPHYARNKTFAILSGRENPLTMPSCRAILQGSEVSVTSGQSNKPRYYVLTRAGSVKLKNYEPGSIEQQFQVMKNTLKGKVPYIVFMGDSTMRLRSDAFIDLLLNNNSAWVTPKSFSSFYFSMRSSKNTNET